ncbi:MAG: hypothetical protein A2X36_13780 [Elusimicrobia bacterium GWA2_69_24]|nr:MAG: hypothetical protein A2X36_13780 [Elusimicrobia bacterium GWA2_69_24]
MEDEILLKLRNIAFSLTGVLLFGTLGYIAVEGWGWFDSLYMTVITLGTIGYGEVHPLTTGGRTFTIVLCFFGLGVVAYAFSALTAFIVEGQLSHVLRRNKMKNRIRALRDHYIVCGAGFTGSAIIEELAKTGRSFVVLEKDPEKAEALRAAGHLALQGDAMHEESLEAAGIRTARGLFSVLDNDRDNVFVTLTARETNPNLKIVSEVHEQRVRTKLLRSGADEVVNSERIGGLRLASVMLRPATVGFLDTMLRDEKSSYRFEEVEVPAGSPLIGKTLEAIPPGGEYPLVVSIKDPQSGAYANNPPRDTELRAGDILVALGSVDQTGRLHQAAKD